MTGIIGSIIGGNSSSGIGSRGSVTVTGNLTLSGAYNGKRISWQNINGGVITLPANSGLRDNSNVIVTIGGSGKIPRIQADATTTVNGVLGGFVIPLRDETVVIWKNAGNN